MKNNLEKIDGRGFKYDGTIFTEEELKNLSEDTRRVYDSFFKNDYTITPLRQYDLDNILKIISEIADKLRTTTGVNNFWFKSKLTAFCVKILNDITISRNSIVDRKKWDNYKTSRQFEHLNESLDFLITNNKIYHLSYGGGISPIDQVNKVIKEHAKKMRATFENDMLVLPQYASQYEQTQGIYLAEKLKWERKSRLGKLLSRLTGKDKEYNDARRRATAYNGATISDESKTINVNGKTMRADLVENRNDDYLFVATTTPYNYENFDINEQIGKSR